MYVEEDFAGESKTKCEEMVGDLKASFKKEILDDASWMSEETKQKAREKLEKMSVLIGYPDFISVEAELNEKYATYEIEGKLPYIT